MNMKHVLHITTCFLLTPVSHQRLEAKSPEPFWVGLGIAAAAFTGGLVAQYFYDYDPEKVLFNCTKLYDTSRQQYDELLRIYQQPYSRATEQTLRTYINSSPITAQKIQNSISELEYAQKSVETAYQKTTRTLQTKNLNSYEMHQHRIIADQLIELDHHIEYICHWYHDLLVITHYFESEQFYNHETSLFEALNVGNFQVIGAQYDTALAYFARQNSKGKIIYQECKSFLKRHKKKLADNLNCIQSLHGPIEQLHIRSWQPILKQYCHTLIVWHGDFIRFIDTVEAYLVRSPMYQQEQQAIDLERQQKKLTKLAVQNEYQVKQLQSEITGLERKIRRNYN